MTDAMPRELKPGIFWLGGCLEQEHFGKTYHSYNAAFLIAGEEASLLVDTGHPKDFPLVERQLTSLLKTRAPLPMVISARVTMWPTFSSFSMALRARVASCSVTCLGGPGGAARRRSAGGALMLWLPSVVCARVCERTVRGGRIGMFRSVRGDVRGSYLGEGRVRTVRAVPHSAHPESVTLRCRFRRRSGSGGCPSRPGRRRRR